MLSVDKGIAPLLKRPFSMYRVFGKDFQILYRVVGKATAILKDKKVGDTIEVMGPLGNGFPKLKPKTTPIFVAGGLGVAPLFSLAELIIQQSQIPPRPPLSKGRWGDFKPLFFLGAKNKKELLCVNELKTIGVNPIIATDDGSVGEKGTVVDILNNFLTSHFSLPTSQLIFACGPKPMLRELSFLSKKLKIDAYGAFEENMACGIGACLGCVIKTVNGYKRVCKEGPVFPLGEIVW